VLVSDISLEPIGGKDGGLDLASFEIVTFVRKPDRAALRAAGGGADDLLEAGGLEARRRDPVEPVLRRRKPADGGRRDLHGHAALRDAGPAA
jgi:hypothetical protein